MDPATIAASLVNLLAPFLHGFVSGVSNAAEEAGEQAASKIRDFAASVWRKLHSKLEQRPTAMEAASKVAEDPEDPDWQAALRAQLKLLLEEDPAFGKEIAKALEDALKAGVIADVVIYGDVQADHGGVVAGRDITGSVHTHGEQADT